MTYVSLVSTDWLQAHLNDPLVRIVDIRGEADDSSAPDPRFLSHYQNYIQSHIPGAVFLNWITELIDDPARMMVAPPEKFVRVMGRIGIAPETYIVAYDGIDGSLAARFWWTLRYYGHRAVGVLDGGWDKWNDRERRPVNDQMPYLAETTFKPVVDMSLRCTGDQVLHELTGSTVLLDTRSENEFLGEDSRARRFGHLPNAVNLPAERLVAEDNTLHQPEQLRRMFGDIGIDEVTPHVIAYGNLGISPCLALLALEIAGLPQGSLYDGSWSEWGNDPKKPIETGG